MGCSSCGKRRKSIQIKRPGPSVPRNGTYLSKGTGDDKKLCPMCRSVMRSLHKYDKSVKKVIKSWYCSKPSCPNSKG